MRTLSTIICLVVIVVSSGVARAGGFFLPIRGAQSMARGGANLAAPSLLDAMWTNPAALVASQGLQLGVDMYLGQQFSSFERFGELYFDDEPVARNQGTPMISLDSPMSLQLSERGTDLMLSGFGLSYDFGGSDLVMGLGVQAPLRGNERYDPLGPQRYSAIDSVPVSINYQLAAAYSISPKLDVGLILQSIYVDVMQSLAMSADPFGEQDLQFDARVRLAASKRFNPSFMLGAIARPWAWLELAASYSQGLNVAADGTLEAEFGPALLALSDGDITVSNPEIGMRFRLPAIARLGARFVQPRFDVELNVVWEDWSVYDKVEVDTRDVILGSTTLERLGVLDGPQTFGTIVLDRNWRDVWRISLGGEYILFETDLRLRAGTYWERGAIPPSYLDVSRMDLDKFAFATGLRWDLDRFFIEAAVAYIICPEVRVEDSQVRLIHALEPDRYDDVIGNGLYRAAYFTAALAVGVRLL